jgi:hypothetical protein
MPAVRVEKLLLPAREHIGNTGIFPLQPIDQAAWIWSSEAEETTPELVHFRRAFTARREPLRLHVSADERYELYLDGRRISRGPDRSGLPRWAYASYRLCLPPGRHVIEALVWHIGDAAPAAQLSHRGGFILKAEEGYDAELTTGLARWKAQRLRGHSFRPHEDTHAEAIGGELVLDAVARFSRAGAWRDAAVIRPPRGKGSPCGVAQRGWMLFPSLLPDQVDRVLCPGRAAAAGARTLPPGAALRVEELRPEALAPWQALIRRGHPLTLPPLTSAFVLWDLGNYYCGYPVLEVSGGRGAEVTWGWSEGLRDADGLKRDRNEIAGKHPLCRGDAFRLDGGRRELTTHWWRSGRYCLLNVETGAAPLTLRRIAVNETRYPLELEGAFDCGDPGMAPLIDLCVRGMQMCSHETFVDCPHYEQLMYVGDTRVEMLTTYTMTRDDRLVRRCIGLFDESRVNWGFVNERYPSRWIQHSPTFSLIWALMLRDYAWWRNDPDGVRARMIGLRSMLEHFEPYVNDAGLLHDLPGWPFMDWVREWKSGVPPGGATGVSATVNLLYAMALQSAAELEGLMGEPLLARRQALRAAAARRATVRLFWDAKRGLMADDPAHGEFSEHAQCLALLGGALTGARARRAFAGLLAAPDLRRCSHYFRFYLFETLRLMGRADLILEKLDTWREMLRLGCRTPLESYGPSRSDCHAWSSHPLFHLYASLAGVRPTAPGFRRVGIEPQLGGLKRLRCRMPHPDGWIELDLRATPRGLAGRVTLPEGITGLIRHGGRQQALRPGSQRIAPGG